jgi:hypothetical protein
MPLETFMKKHFFMGFLTLMMISGCAIYHPQTTDIPLISEKKDLRIDAGVSLIPSAHATVSYGLTNHIALQVFGSAGIEHRYYFQFAPGLYKKFTNLAVMELYSGIGYGYGNTYKNPLASDIGPRPVGENLFGNYQIYFVQFNLGKNTSESDRIDYGIGLKTGLFHSNLTDRNFYNYSFDTGPFTLYSENKLLLEPALFFRYGKERVRFSYKIGFTRIFKLSDQDHYVPAPWINMGFGINFKPAIK